MITSASGEDGNGFDVWARGLPSACQLPSCFSYHPETLPRSSSSHRGQYLLVESRDVEYPSEYGSPLVLSTNLIY